MRVRELLCKSILSRSGIYGVNYSINPYIGCEHNCAYCYARGFVRKFITNIEWGEEVLVKVNAPQVLSKEIMRAEKGLVLLSSITDPYQPVEAEYKITRQILERLLSHQFPVSILTKSTLVKRDLDVISKFKEAEVGFTVITLNENFRKILEPRAPSIEERLETLRIFKERGIHTYLFVGPILPFVTEGDLEELVKEAKRVANEIIFDKFNFKYDSLQNLKTILKEEDPILLKRLLDGFKDRNFPGKIKQRATELCSKFSVPYSFCY